MAASVVSFKEDRLVHGSLKQGIRRQKTLSGEKWAGNGLKSCIRALVGFWEGPQDSDTSRKSCGSSLEVFGTSASLTGQKSRERELFRPYRAPEPQVTQPPSYEDSVADLPPDYTATDALAAVYFPSLPLDSAEAKRKPKQQSRPHFFKADDKVDLSAIEGIRSHANKKAKKAAKAAQQAKWADSDNEEKKDGDGEENADGDGAGGGGAGGDGGDPPGGGDDGDDWFNDFKKKDVSLMGQVLILQVPLFLACRIRTRESMTDSCVEKEEEKERLGGFRRGRKEASGRGAEAGRRRCREWRRHGNGGRSNRRMGRLHDREEEGMVPLNIVLRMEIATDGIALTERQKGQSRAGPDRRPRAGPDRRHY